MFHDKDGLFFDRNHDGSVTIIKTTDGKEPSFPTPPDFPPEFGREEGNLAFSVTIDEGPWCSIVLSMSAFSERPGDWHAWMRHHKGEEDLLVGKRGGY
jgi:hypothetical protein